ncbi:MAG: hypothetical protein IJZ35_05635 [Clostridia bacterium]|nr:hypothetical protein [Clostridia bacterium]
MDSVYFLGANTPQGFYSLFKELYNPYDKWEMYIIKGGPGTGKSTLMKQVAQKAAEKGIAVDRIPCSSDPNSLDGIIIPSLKIAMCDGTSPHIVEPVFPGVCEHLINLSECWDKNKLKDNASKIKLISMTNSSAHQKCLKYLKTAKLIDDELSRYIMPAVNHEKIKRFTERLTELKYDKAGESVQKTRFLSALTPIGININYDTFKNDCDKIIKIKDSHNISHIIIKSILKDFDRSIIKYNCPLEPESKTEHIIFTDIKLGIFTSNIYHPMKEKTYKTVSTDRFIDKDILNEHKSTIAFLNKTKSEMINEAILSLQTAKASHDILESYYIEAMDFDKVNNIKEKTINEIFN